MEHTISNQPGQGTTRRAFLKQVVALTGVSAGADGGIVPAPCPTPPPSSRYVVLCNFDEFWVYDFDQVTEDGGFFGGSSTPIPEWINGRFRLLGEYPMGRKRIGDYRSVRRLDC